MKSFACIFVLTILVSCSSGTRIKYSVTRKPFAPETLQVVPGWGALDGASHQGTGSTHGGVAVNRAGEILVSADSGVHVFTPQGERLRTLDNPALHHLHALTLVNIEGEEVLFGAANHRAEIVKFDALGNVFQRIPFPKESGIQGRYVPTAVAVAPDGRILVADGYGTNHIFVFDGEGNYLRNFGGRDKNDPKKFHTPHGITLDTRYDPPRFLVSDREKRRLVHFSLDGEFLGEVATGLRRPCAVSIYRGYVAIAELEGRVAILDRENELVAALGDNPDKKQWANYNVKPDAWRPGVFTAPHGLSWDRNGNLYVQDWNKTGRVSKWMSQSAPGE